MIVNEAQALACRHNMPIGRDIQRGPIVSWPIHVARDDVKPIVRDLRSGKIWKVGSVVSNEASNPAEIKPVRFEKVANLALRVTRKGNSVGSPDFRMSIGLQRYPVSQQDVG